MTAIAWRPSQAQREHLHISRFMAHHGLSTYDELAARSVADPEWFWDAVVAYLGVPFQSPYSVVADRSGGPQWTTWFPDGSINLSEACVDRWAAEQPDAPALISENEAGEVSELTFAELLDSVGRHAAALVGQGVEKGDRVAVYLPMNNAAVISMLAVARTGAVFVPVFSGFGPDAIAARLDAAQPKVFVVGDGVLRRGNVVPMAETAAAALAESSADPTVLMVHTAPGERSGADRVWFEDLVEQAEPMGAVRTNAEDPALLTYTSGTTGKPKGIVHVHGGMTVKLIQEGAFQLDIHPGDRHMWLTDMGWVMGQWTVVAGLGNGATVVTYDGAPDRPDAGRVWKLVEDHQINSLGISPTYVRSIQPLGTEFADRHDLSSLRAFGSTGEPWNPDPWWWLYRDVGKEQIPIVNISGGTEIAACLLSANLYEGIKPISVGGPSLGIDLDVFDPDGAPLDDGVGELVVKASWPGMTRGFWQDNDRFLETYWSRWEDIWVHGDWASVDEDGFWYLHGRSDETLNVGGKRLGPAEVESIVVEDPDVMMAAAVGVPDAVKGEGVAVFVVLSGNHRPESEIARDLSDAIASSLGKPFRPKAVTFVDDLPRTRSAKIMRRVVKARALGKDTGDLSSLENPAAVSGILPIV